ncbi:MAG: ROK family protein [Rhodospirillales bacterium]
MRIGIDLGGTKIEGILLSSGGHVLRRKRVPTPQGDYTRTIQAICDLVDELETGQSATCTVGIGIPGTIAPDTRLVKNANSTWLIGKPLDRDLMSALQRPVRLANDADCFAMSEATDGAAAGCQTVFGVILGTGVGGGIVISHHLLAGPNAIAGEWGHNPLPAMSRSEQPGTACYCGRTGCIETFLSGPGLATRHHQRTGEELSAEQIASLATPTCEASMAAYEDQLARALGSIINIIDPDAIVLGGGLSKIERLFRNVPLIWERYVFSPTVVTRLLPPKHGDSSGVRGAAWLWQDERAG